MDFAVASVDEVTEIDRKHLVGESPDKDVWPESIKFYLLLTEYTDP